jgi:hypothetical protein
MKLFYRDLTLFKSKNTWDFDPQKIYAGQKKSLIGPDPASGRLMSTTDIHTRVGPMPEKGVIHYFTKSNGYLQVFSEYSFVDNYSFKNTNDIFKNLVQLLDVSHLKMFINYFS